MNKTQPRLTEHEKAIIINKGTEAPGTGELIHEKREGIYLCRQCGSPLYVSDHKFASSCGWPAFDDAIPGQVHMTTDSDGMHTEITCTQCGGHLGHVFIGERLTDQNTRHCVNSASMVFTTEDVQLPEYEVTTFGAGCFWCVEAIFQLLQGVLEVRSGYMGGEKQFPTYEMVSSGRTRHVEVAHVYYNPGTISYGDLVKVFFSVHNPTTLDRQGADIGPQYASVIFYHNDDQKSIAQNIMHDLDQQGLWDDPIVTRIETAKKFWLAEGYHQNYYQQNTSQPYCQVVISPKVQSLKNQWKHLLK